VRIVVGLCPACISQHPVPENYPGAPFVLIGLAENNAVSAHYRFMEVKRRAGSLKKKGGFQPRCPVRDLLSNEMEL
jgi:hypothetical protein